jgi:hypothetical protein
MCATQTDDVEDNVRRLRYRVATSLDGFIEGPNGEDLGRRAP